jgi:hypothetical protein
MSGDKVVPITYWEVFDFPWGTAVRDWRNKKWVKVFLKPDGQEIDVRFLSVEIHENGIEFC